MPLRGTELFLRCIMQTWGDLFCGGHLPLDTCLNRPSRIADILKYFVFPACNLSMSMSYLNRLNMMLKLSSGRVPSCAFSPGAVPQAGRGAGEPLVVMHGSLARCY